MYERAIEKLGGAFKLTVLLQKRVREIIRGSSPLVPVSPEMSPIDIAMQEILDDKISLGEDDAAGTESDEKKKSGKKKAAKKAAKKD